MVPLKAKGGEGDRMQTAFRRQESNHDARRNIVME